MSGSSPAPAPAPQPADPYAVAAAQQGTNLASLIDTQASQNVNQVTPTGSLTYQQTGTGPDGVPTYTAIQQNSPAQQELLELSQQTQGIASGAASNILGDSFDQYSKNPADLIGNMTSGTTKDLLGKETSYLDPFFKDQTSQLDTQLRNQGIMPGTPAYDQQMRAVAANQNQAVTGFLAQAEPQAYQQAVTTYGLPLATAQQLSGGQV